MSFRNAITLARLLIIYRQAILALVRSTSNLFFTIQQFHLGLAAVQSSVLRGTRKPFAFERIMCLSCCPLLLFFLPSFVSCRYSVRRRDEWAAYAGAEQSHPHVADFAHRVHMKERDAANSRGENYRDTGAQVRGERYISSEETEVGW